LEETYSVTNGLKGKKQHETVQI